MQFFCVKYAFKCGSWFAQHNKGNKKKQRQNKLSSGEKETIFCSTNICKTSVVDILEFSPLSPPSSFVAIRFVCFGPCCVCDVLWMDGCAQLCFDTLDLAVSCPFGFKVFQV